MTKEQLVMALDEVERQRQILVNELKKMGHEEPPEDENQDFPEESTENRDESEEKTSPKTVGAATKDIFKEAVVSGNLKNAMTKVSGALDFAKVGVNSFSEVLDKAKAKMEGNIEELPGPTGIPIMTDMWIPMILGLMQTQEFQHLMSNMLVQLIKD